MSGGWGAKRGECESLRVRREHVDVFISLGIPYPTLTMREARRSMIATYLAPFAESNTTGSGW